ncbi:MAG TPA: hypothetical protein PLG21_12230 [Anaerolineae bacterium]|nr:hypothetical protein [Anaerolineae bacterium]
MRPSMRRWLFLAVLVLVLAACTPTPVLVSTPSPQASTPVGAVRELPPSLTPTAAPRATKEPGEVLGAPGAATPTAIDADHRAFTDWTYGVSLQIPAGWTAIAGYGARYGGPDGYFDLGARSGALSIDEVTALEAGHHLQPYGSSPTIEKLTIQGQEARLILPSADQDVGMENRVVLIVRYPVPVKGYGYFELGADQGHIRELAATLAFLTSVEAGPVDGWTGTLVKNCSMAQFDDYFQRDDGLRCGVAGATETVNVEIERLRCQPSAQVRVWGQLEMETVDANGLRIVVERLEVLSTPPSPTPWPGPSEEPVAGWEGYVISCGEAGTERSFLRSDGARLGIDTQQAEALEALRLAECEGYRVRIWGTLYRETAGLRIAAERVERIEVGTTAEAPTPENQP